MKKNGKSQKRKQNRRGIERIKYLLKEKKYGKQEEKRRRRRRLEKEEEG